MHFWIDKRSQGCVRYSNRNRYHIPPSISGYGRNQRNLSNSYYSEPMVTPVRRFQSIESVANNGLRFTRTPGYHVRQSQHTQCSPTVHIDTNRISEIERGMNLIASAPVHSDGRNVRNIHSNTKLKCGIITLFFLLVTFFLATARYLFSGYVLSLGVEAFIFSLLLLFILILGGLITACDATKDSPEGIQVLPPTAVQEPPEIMEDNQNRSPPQPNDNMAEMPPPPYHIAMMLSPTNDLNSIRLMGDSPPPSYEKAVT